MSKKPVPKKQQAKSSSRSRHSKYVYKQRERLGALQLTECTQCGAKRRAHYACGECGYYKGNQILNVKAKKEDANVQAIEA